MFYIIHRDNPTEKGVCVCMCGRRGGSLVPQLVPCVNEKRNAPGYEARGRGEGYDKREAGYGHTYLVALQVR